jgi:cytidylate kinase
LKQTEDARLLDTSALTIDEAVAKITSWYQEVRGDLVQSEITVLPN